MTNKPPSAAKDSLLTKAAQVGNSQVIANAWKVGNSTKPLQERILRDFYRGLRLRAIQKTLYTPAGKCPPADFILDVIRNNTHPKGAL